MRNANKFLVGNFAGEGLTWKFRHRREDYTKMDSRRIMLEAVY
jgi:hypothetical protein